MQISAVRAEIIGWATPILSCDTAWIEDASSVQGSATNAILQIRSLSREGADAVHEDGGIDEVTVAGSRLLTLRIVVTSADAFDRLLNLHAALSLPTQREALLAAKLAIVADSGVSADDTGARASLDLHLRVPFELIDRPGEIRSANALFEIFRPDSSLALAESVTFTR